MAGWDNETQRAGNIPGALRVECGEFTNSGDGTVFIPTGFTELIGGFGSGDLTDHMIGHAVSLCEGPTIRMAFTDSTGSAKISYVAFGF